VAGEADQDHRPVPAGRNLGHSRARTEPRPAGGIRASHRRREQAGRDGQRRRGLRRQVAADGYTLLLADIGSLAISPSIFSTLPFEPVKDFAPVIMVAYSPHLLVVHPSVTAKDAKELIAQAKAKPDALNFAVSGIGGANHLAGVDFAQRAGIKWTYVPYKGGSQALTDMVGGQSQVMFNGMLATYPFVKDGKLKALAISSAKRFLVRPRHSDGRRGGGNARLRDGSYQGIVAPAGTPPEIVNKLHATITADPRHARDEGSPRQGGRGAAADVARAVRRLHPRREGESGRRS
jgi:tripartite-type tricarboxylate transporter receptor subunit TctC